MVYKPRAEDLSIQLYLVANHCQILPVKPKNMTVQESLEKLRQELKLRNYSPKTVKAYLYCVESYLVTKGDGLSLNVSHLKNFLESKLDAGAAPETTNLYLNAAKFFYREVLKVRDKIDIHFARRNIRIPVVLNRGEVDRILEAVKNSKHRLIISLAYAAGLRVSEVVNLKIGEVDLVSKLIVIRSGKGGKDRVSVLSEKLIDPLKKFMTGKKPQDYLFESERGGNLHMRTAQKVFQKAVELAGIGKRVSFHSLRHSFATHCLENGIDIRYVQDLLGHANIRTTQRYTQVSRIKLAQIRSPF